ncbi:lipopolysaccharide biosynthesis protein [Alloalcanivorax venustensis]|uniref:lipopolysaccharide biosynthesis protein n=1 Tax=Alloalcanivorax venustensis TaxID=172371 RepID=UPI0039C140CB
MKQKIEKDSFFKSVGVILSGTVFAQAVTLFVAPFITRLYSPSEFGLFAVYISVMAIIVVLGSLRYEMAILLPRKRRDAYSILILCFLIAMPISILVFAVLSYLSFSSLQISAYFLFLPFAFFATVGCQILTKWQLREKKFHRIAVSRVAQSSLTAAVQLSFFKGGPLGLIAAHFLGQVIQFIILKKNAVFARDVFRENKKKLEEVAFRYRRFPLFDTSYAVFFAAGQQSPTVLLGLMFGPSAAGLYALSERVLSAPLNVIGGAVGSVFFSHVSDSTSVLERNQMILNVYTKMFYLSLMPAVIIFLFGEEVFGYVFGEAWIEAGKIATYLVPFFVSQFVVSPLITIFAVLEEQKAAAFLQGAIFFARIIVLILGSMFWSLETVVVMFSVVSVIGAILQLCFIFWRCKIPPLLVLFNHIKIALVFLLLLVFFEFTNYWIFGNV